MIAEVSQAIHEPRDFIAARDKRVKFYRPDLKFAPVHDFPCSQDDHDDCVGINGPWKCPCECHEMTDEEIAGFHG